MLGVGSKTNDIKNILINSMKQIYKDVNDKEYYLVFAHIVYVQ